MPFPVGFYCVRTTKNLRRLLLNVRRRRIRNFLRLLNFLRRLSFFRRSVPNFRCLRILL